MYAYISGKLVDMQEGAVVVDNQGIGYELFVSNTTLSQLPPVGHSVRLFVYQIVKEDELSLYGFYSSAEKQMFTKLISVSGVGPKLAQAVLSGMSVNALSSAILTGDVKSMAKVKGVGKKTAERIVLELKENVGEDIVSLQTASPASPSGSYVDSVCADALDALESMGLSRSQAYEAVLRARQTTDQVAEIVRYVLRGWKQ